MIDAAVELVRDVGQALLSWRSAGGAEGVWEGTQFHANADQWAHQRLTAGLAAMETGLPVVSEESLAPDDISRASRYWLIDPIDGTASYAGGFAGYVTQIALMENESPVLAVVFAPQYQDLFVAEKGGGAFRNGTRLPVASSSSFLSSLTLIDNYPGPRGIAADLYDELSFTRYVECGSIGLKICRVAEGAADVFMKAVQVRDWDLAAPHLILQEAGGCLVDGSGQDVTYGGRRIHHGLVAATGNALAHRVVSWHQAHVADKGVIG